MCSEPNFVFDFHQSANDITENVRHGIHLVPGVVELFISLFAGDAALLSIPTSGFQNELHCLKTCCDQMKLEVNKNKTNIMVFRKKKKKKKKSFG